MPKSMTLHFIALIATESKEDIYVYYDFLCTIR